MSAALLQDDVASRQLRERFYLSAIDPEQADSATFLQALEELRDVQLNDVGAPLDRADWIRSLPLSSNMKAAAH